MLTWQTGEGISVDIRVVTVDPLGDMSICSTLGPTDVETFNYKH